MVQTRRLNYGWRLWLSSVLVLTLPFLCLWFTYSTSSRLVEAQTFEANLSLLAHTRDVLDGRLTEIDNLGARILMDARVNRLARMTHALSRAEVYRLREAWLDLSRYTLANNYLLDFFILLPDTDTVLTPGAPYIGIENFYKHYFHYGNLDYNQWRALQFDAYHKRQWLPAAQVVLSGRSLRALTYLQSMSTEINASSGVIVLMIDEKQIHTMLERIQPAGGGWVCVLDASGRLMTSIGAPPKALSLPEGQDTGYFETTFSGETMLVSFTRSAVNRWAYLSAVPKAMLMQRLDWLQSLMRGAAATALAAGLLLAALIAVRNARPMREQAPLLRQSFFDRLFAGDFHTEEEITAYLDHIGYAFGGARYAVLLLRLGVESAVTSENLTHLAQMRAALYRAVPRAGDVCHPIGITDVAVLFVLPETADFAQSVRQLCDRLHAQGVEGMIRRVGTGLPCDSLLDVHTSYLQARKAMRYSAATDGLSVTRYETLPTGDTVFDFSLRMETRLTHLVMAGSRAETQALLTETYRQNIEERRLSLDMAHHYTNELFNTAMKIIGQLPKPNAELLRAASSVDAALRDDAPLDEIHGMIMSLYDALCLVSQAARRSRSEEHAQGLLAFVAAHAYEESLSLSVIASAFNKTDAYVSQYFKENTGENFSEYLEGIRLHRAQELLAREGMPVYRIAAEIGYGNDNTFRRAFKRRFGISPSEYRDSPRKRQE